MAVFVEEYSVLCLFERVKQYWQEKGSIKYKTKVL